MIHENLNPGDLYLFEDEEDFIYFIITDGILSKEEETDDKYYKIKYLYTKHQRPWMIKYNGSHSIWITSVIDKYSRFIKNLDSYNLFKLVNNDS